MPGFDYTEWTNIATSILRGLCSARGLSFTVDRQAEIAHDATVELYQRCLKRGSMPDNLWASLRPEVRHQLWNRKAKRRDAEAMIPEDMPMPTTDADDVRGWYRDILTGDKGLLVIFTIQTSPSLRKMYRALDDTMGRRWTYDNARKCRHIYEVLKWQNGNSL